MEIDYFLVRALLAACLTRRDLELQRCNNLSRADSLLSLLAVLLADNRCLNRLTDFKRSLSANNSKIKSIIGLLIVLFLSLLKFQRAKHCPP